MPDRESKSISHETTFPVDISDTEVLRSCLLTLTEQVARRMRRLEIFGRTVQLKYRYSDFRTVTRSHSLPQPTNTTREIWSVVSEQLLPRVDASQPVRLVGVGVTSLGHQRSQQRLLFEEHDSRDDDLDSATDEIRDRFGVSAISRGSAIRRQQNPD